MFITAVCFIFLIKLRWPKTKSLYKNILPFYKLVATYKNCPETTLILKRASGKVTKVKFII